MGPAWYQREIAIPKEWKGKRIFLYFERTHWLSSVYVGKQEISKIDYVSVPHNHELTEFVKPGKTELITFCIDNRYQYDTHKWDHAHFEFTQINWNGVLGEIKLVAGQPHQKLLFRNHLSSFIKISQTNYHTITSGC